MRLIKKLKTGLKAYIALLNMNPEASRIINGRLSRTYDKDSKLWIHILLFFMTIITTTLSGQYLLGRFKSGMIFSIIIMSILLAHEMGHYIAARHFGVKATLPYFIPFPSIIGTMGAVIRIKSPIRNKRALLFIGALGPILGFVLSLLAIIVGLYYSEIRSFPAKTTEGLSISFGDSILLFLITKLIHGQIPAGQGIPLSPYIWAGWIGFLVTSLNLMPMGQLDGGHIVYALIGRKQLYIGWITLIVLVILSFVWFGWILWILITLLFIMIGHPPIEDDDSLSFQENLIGWFCVIIFVLTFIPVPVKFI